MTKFNMIMSKEKGEIRVNKLHLTKQLEWDRLRQILVVFFSNFPLLFFPFGGIFELLVVH